MAWVKHISRSSLPVSWLWTKPSSAINPVIFPSWSILWVQYFATWTWRQSLVQLMETNSNDLEIAVSVYNYTAFFCDMSKMCPKCMWQNLCQVQTILSGLQAIWQTACEGKIFLRPKHWKHCFHSMSSCHCAWATCHLSSPFIVL